MKSTVSVVIFLSICVKLSENASVLKPMKPLDIFKNDISSVGGAIENFAFDVIKTFVDENDYEFSETDADTETGGNEGDQENTTKQFETTTISENELSGDIKIRKTRSVGDGTDEEIRELCQKRYSNCNKGEETETHHLQDLKSEVHKLQELVKLLKDQQDLIHVLKEDHSEDADSPKKQPLIVHEKRENSIEIKTIKNDLMEAIADLNRIKKVIDNQKKRNELLESEITKQSREIKTIKSIIKKIITNNNETVADNIVGISENNSQNMTPSAESIISARASEFSELKKFLSDTSSSNENIDDSDEVQNRILELEKKLKKRKRNQSLNKQIKMLEKRIIDEDNNQNSFLKQLALALEKKEGPSENSDNIDNLSDLQDAINRLRPKENNDNNAQFQAMLTKLLNNNNNNNRPLSINQKQPNFQVNSGSFPAAPHSCLDESRSGFKSNYQPTFYNDPAPPSYYPQRPQFFQAPQPSFHPPEHYNAETPDKSVNYQFDVNQKYQEDLKKQIEGLQAAIDHLNRPEYYQKPEDQRVVQDLEHQINDLKGVVDNLNPSSYDAAPYRTKRDIEDNRVSEGDEMVGKLTGFMGKLLNDRGNDNQIDLEELQNRIDNIKNQLGILLIFKNCLF